MRQTPTARTPPGSAVRRWISKEREPGRRVEFYRVCECDVRHGRGRLDPGSQAVESVVESAAVELGAHGGGDRLAEATMFIAFLRGESEGMLECWAEYRRDPR